MSAFSGGGPQGATGPAGAAGLLLRFDSTDDVGTGIADGEFRIDAPGLGNNLSVSSELFISKNDLESNDISGWLNNLFLLQSGIYFQITDVTDPTVTAFIFIANEDFSEEADHFAFLYSHIAGNEDVINNGLYSFNPLIIGAPGSAGVTGATGPVNPREIEILVTSPLASAAALTTGDAQAVIMVSDDLNGLNLTDADACVGTQSSSGDVTVQVRRKRAGSSVDMLSTAIVVQANEDCSYTGTTGGINGSNDDVATGDLIYIDVDGAGTGVKGLIVTLQFA